MPISDDVETNDVTVDIRRLRVMPSGVIIGVYQCHLVSSRARRTHLSVRVKDQVPLEGDLWKDIRADESGWLIDKEANQRCIIITLIKRDARA